MVKATINTKGSRVQGESAEIKWNLKNINAGEKEEKRMTKNKRRKERKERQEKERKKERKERKEEEEEGEEGEGEEKEGEGGEEEGRGLIITSGLFSDLRISFSQQPRVRQSPAHVLFQPQNQQQTI